MNEVNDTFSSTETMDNFNSTTTLTTRDRKISIEKTGREYDIYEHRKLEHPNTYTGALIHIIKSSLGAGILAVPMAFQYTGMVVGFIGTLFVGYVCTHCIRILIEASHKMCKIAERPSMGFSETLEATFRYGPPMVRPLATPAKYFVDITLTMTYLFGIVAYVILIYDTLNDIMPHIYPNKLSRATIICIISCLLALCCQVRPLKFLVPFSAIANFTMVIAFLVTFYCMITNIISQPAKTVHWFENLEGLPHFLVTIIFAMEGIGTILPVENSLEKPQFLGGFGVLNVGMAFVVGMFTAMGMFGYYVYGDLLQPSITYNLPSDQTITIFGQPFYVAIVGKACIAIAVFFTYTLQFYVPMEISWRHMNRFFPQWSHNVVQIVWRFLCVAFVSVIAILIPDLTTMITIMGAVFLSTLGLFMPVVADTVVNWNNLECFYWRLIKNFGITCIYLIAFCFGIYYNV